MKTQKLIKQAEELLGGIVGGKWNIFRGPYACGISEDGGDVALDFLAVSFEKAQFVVFARNHMQEFIDKLQKYEEVLNKIKIRSRHGFEAVPFDVQELVRQALEEE